MKWNKDNINEAIDLTQTLDDAKAIVILTAIKDLQNLCITFTRLLEASTDALTMYSVPKNWRSVDHHGETLHVFKAVDLGDMDGLYAGRKARDVLRKVYEQFPEKSHS